jgi:hypothetical protein
MSGKIMKKYQAHAGINIIHFSVKYVIRISIRISIPTLPQRSVNLELGLKEYPRMVEAKIKIPH